MVIISAIVGISIRLPQAPIEVRIRRGRLTAASRFPEKRGRVQSANYTIVYYSIAYCCMLICIMLRYIML